MPINLARRGCFGHEFALRTSLGKLAMSSIERAVTAVTAILVREGIDYLQSKAVFKAARQRAGLQAPPDRRAGIDRLTIEEELRFIDQAYVRGGRTGLLLQTLLETGARVSEFVQIRTEDVSLAERVIVIRRGKGGKRREVPIRRELAQLLQLHIGVRRAGPLFASRQRGSGTAPYVYTRQRVGQIVREVARAAGVTKRVYPHLLRHTVATKLLALGMDITDVQRFLGHESLTTTRLYAETTAAVLRRKFDQITAPAAHALVATVQHRHGNEAALLAADLLMGHRVERFSPADA
jgi:integrase/recombinase XerD